MQNLSYIFPSRIYPLRKFWRPRAKLREVKGSLRVIWEGTAVPAPHLRRLCGPEADGAQERVCSGGTPRLREENMRPHGGSFQAGSPMGPRDQVP